MTARGSRRLAAAAVAAAVALGGCGGGGGGVSKEDYASDLDELCAELEGELRSMGEITPANPAELRRQLARIQRTIADGIRRLKAVERPDGEAGETAREYIEELESSYREDFLPALDALSAAVRAKDPVKIRAAATRLQSIDEKRTEELARELGANACAEE
jgi:hypothetical protein